MTRRALTEALLGLCWRQWTTLGVRGAMHEKSGVAIALEELMLLTAQLGANDPRLRDEALDWCVANNRFVARPRLKALLTRLEPEAIEAFVPWSRTLSEHVGGNWPDVGHDGGANINLSRKSLEPALEQPELLQLRMRALFGVGARADVICAALAWPSPSFIASDLTYLGYSKRNLATVMDSLSAGGLLDATRIGNQLRFAWKRREELIQLVSPLPKLLPRWPIILEVVSAVVNLIAKNESKSERLAAIAAAKAFSRLDKELKALGLKPPMATPIHWPTLYRWIVDEMTALADGTSPMLRSGASLTPAERRK